MHDDGCFDEKTAATYDADCGLADPRSIDPVVNVLADLADDGPALELAVGTGRIALPLAAKGIPVHGIELSSAMVARLRDKAGGADIPVTMGDMAATRVPGLFSLVYLVFNTINNLTTQEAQVACFQNAAAHLAPGGRFLIEVGIPPLQRLPLGETTLAFERTADHWGMDAFDVVTQAFTSHHIRRRNGHWEETAIPFRYVWPAELDLMARLAGLTLEARWDNWQRQPLTATSTQHVSVWRKPAA